MKEIIKAQQGSIFDPKDIKIGKFKYSVKANKSGIVRRIGNREISRIARIAGAPLNKGAGIFLHKHVKNKVKKEEKLFTIYSESRQKLDFAKEALKNTKAFAIR
jgi:thymidine phosphorylase